MSLIILIGLLVGFNSIASKDRIDEAIILSHIVNLDLQELKFYWKDRDGKNFSNFQKLKSGLETDSIELIFAMNGGMYLKDLSPQGLYIENGNICSPIDTIKNGYGNFYLQPNGVFYLTMQNKPTICSTDKFERNENIKYATQSGPMLLIDGEIHSEFNKGSVNKHIRNGVGILPNGNLLFAMSKETINFYDFASYFKQNGCKNALYLDGFVSRAYLPEKKWIQLDGNFGVIIGETKYKRP